MNNISFQGHSTLISDRKIYDNARQITTGAYRHLNPHNKCKLTNGKVFTTNTDAKSIAVIIRNEKDGIIKHIPVSAEVGKYIDEISAKIELLKTKAKGKLTAWIIGGSKIDSAGGDETIKTVNKIANVICDKPDIDTSIIVGSKTGNDNIVIHTLNGELELGLEKTPANFRKSAPEESFEDLFDIVEFNNTDVVVK